MAKSSEVHVVDALRTTLDEAVAIVADSVAFLRANDLRVFLDAEHFFDGFKANPAFTLRILQAAEEAGAETLVLCDTNGGTLPFEVERIVTTVLDRFESQVGVHFHNDSGCAVANSLAGVSVGATHVQGCVNGYGERAGNADLAGVVPDLSLKLKVATIPSERLPLLTPVAHHISELVNIARTRSSRSSAPRCSPTRRDCTHRPSPAGPTPTSTSRPTWSVTAPGSWCRRWPAGRHWP